MLGTLLPSSPENQWDVRIKQGKRQQNLKLHSAALWRIRALEFRAQRTNRQMKGSDSILFHPSGGHHGLAKVLAILFWLFLTGRRSHLLAGKHAGILPVNPWKSLRGGLFGLPHSDFMSTNDHNYMLIPTTTYKTHRWLPLPLFIISQYDCLIDSGTTTDLKLICARSCPYKSWTVPWWSMGWGFPKDQELSIQ